MKEQNGMDGTKLKESLKVILDCDIGHDDAIALMLGAAYPGKSIVSMQITDGDTYISA